MFRFSAVYPEAFGALIGLLIAVGGAGVVFSHYLWLTLASAAVAFTPIVGMIVILGGNVICELKEERGQEPARSRIDDFLEGGY